MSRRTRPGWTSVLFIAVGVTLMVLSYFLWTAPWCTNSVDCSNPEFEWASLVFVSGVIIAFLSAVHYTRVGSDRGRS